MGSRLKWSDLTVGHNYEDSAGPDSTMSMCDNSVVVGRSDLILTSLEYENRTDLLD